MEDTEKSDVKPPVPKEPRTHKKLNQCSAKEIKGIKAHLELHGMENSLRYKQVAALS